MRKHLILLLTSIVLLSGCQSSFGPSGLSNTHPAYNQTIINTLNQQMLLNLVRLKYRDESYFLTISSVTSSLNFTGNIGVNASMNLLGSNSISPQLGVSYSDSPTISYQPLQGEDFLKGILSPISLESILVMSQSGWDIKRIFGICIERINNILNAPRASGPAPAIEPEYKKFKALLDLFKEFQYKGRIEIGPSAFDNKKLVMMFKTNTANKNMLSRLANLLNFTITDNGKVYIELTNNFINTDTDKMAIRTRSISSVLFYLSQGIDIPEDHIEEGLVTITKTKSGSNFNWANTPAGSAFKVKVSYFYPDNAFIAVNYRNHWFYIEDSDLNSKSTFMLLTQLFDLQAGQSSYSAPTLTLPVR
ncbi:MAG: hypothetical protein Q9M50_05015 [Methylococcales bacterium]|nr:hypothetical protein [Methylococcales bacterium]